MLSAFVRFDWYFLQIYSYCSYTGHNRNSAPVFIEIIITPYLGLNLSRMKLKSYKSFLPEPLKLLNYPYIIVNIDCIFFLGASFYI